MKKYIIITGILLGTTFVFAQYPSSVDYRSAQRQKGLNERLTTLERNVEGLSTRIKAIEEKLNPTPELKKQGKAKRIETVLKIGQIIYFDHDARIKIIQIIDQLNMIVEVPTYRDIGNYREEYEKIVWLRGLDTSKWADDTIINPNPNQLFKITGTQKYIATLGSQSTLFVLEPYND
jgi:hypothetical protein